MPKLLYGFDSAAKNPRFDVHCRAATKNVWKTDCNLLWRSNVPPLTLNHKWKKNFVTRNFISFL